jgi:hypothetical protein
MNMLGGLVRSLPKSVRSLLLVFLIFIVSDYRGSEKHPPSEHRRYEKGYFYPRSAVFRVRWGTDGGTLSESLKAPTFSA